MFVEQLAAEVARACLYGLDQLSRLTWQGHAAAAQHIAEQIEHRRQKAKNKTIGLPSGHPSIFLPNAGAAVTTQRRT